MQDIKEKYIGESFLYFIKIGIIPYIVFSALLLLIFLFYFLIFYRLNFKKLQKDFKGLTKRKRIELIIFLLGGIFISYILFYFSLNVIMPNNDSLSKYQSASINNSLINFWDNKIFPFLVGIGLVK